MAACKCRFCQAKLMTNNACKATIKKQTAYFCNEEHHLAYIVKIEEEKREKEKEKEAKKELTRKLKEEKKEKEREKTEKYKADKNKAYYLICEIINRKEIINTALWKEWALWNKVASNEVIGQYLEENKEYLCSIISGVEDKEFNRIRYLSAILKNKLGDYKPNIKDAQKPKVVVDETFYESATTSSKKRRSLANLEDEF